MSKANCRWRELRGTCKPIPQFGGYAERQKSRAAWRVERTAVTSEVEYAMLHAPRTRMQLVTAEAGQAKAARQVASAPEQALAPDRE